MHLSKIFKDAPINQDRLKDMNTVSNRFETLRNKEQLTNDEKAEIKNLAAYLGINL